MIDRKTVLYFALAAVIVLLWSAWQRDYQEPKPIINQPTATSSLGTAPGLTTPKASAVAEAKVPSSQTITAKTDVLEVTIDKKGGNIISVKLPAYPTSYETPNQPVNLLTNAPENYYIAESGLIGNGGPDTDQQQAVYQSNKNHYELATNQNVLEVPLQWKNQSGLTVVKTFKFERGKYNTNISYQINNEGKQTWSGNMYAQIKRRGLGDSESMFGLKTYQGAAISSPKDAYQKVSYKKMDKTPLDQIIQGGWLAMQQRYFVSAWIPQANQNYRYYSRVEPVGPSNKSYDKIYTIGLASPPISLAPGAQTKTGAIFYAGPEIADQLKALAPHLDLVIDYGWLWIFSVPIFKLMQLIYSVIGNWGWAIVLVTVIIKLLFYKLSETSYRSMAKMRNIQPSILALKDRYGEDRQKLSQATMELYRKEKINPLGGCLPMLVQIPVFIALYYVLIESVELRQAPFIFWIHDLSVKDPYYVLPILMGLSWLIQQKLNPPPPDPTQAKLMMALPIVFTFLFAAFPAGLVLYWLVNNCLSILQQWYIMRKYETQEPKKKQVQKPVKQ